MNYAYYYNVISAFLLVRHSLLNHAYTQHLMLSLERAVPDATTTIIL